VAGRAQSDLQHASGEARVAEIARMLGGERLSGTAHAQALLQGAAAPAPAATPTSRAAKRRSRT
jgi:DNA repair protein RecN (Recombination protein N)